MLAALCLALIASAIALPHNTTDRISKRDGPKIHIGYRSVSSVCFDSHAYENVRPVPRQWTCTHTGVDTGS
jgi:hypothetical protein